MNFHGKKVLIFGLGQYEQGSGVSAALFFIRQGAKVVVTDMKTASQLGKTVKMLRGKVTFHLGGHRMEDVRQADIVMRNPGVPNNSPYLREARKRGIPVYTDVSLFMLLCPCWIIGVTGTRGKSTTTALIGEMLKRKNKKTFVGGNIQRSPLSFLDKLDRSSLVVLELSSWLLESLADIKRSPQTAVVTNIYPDHLNIHGSMRAYVHAKENIFRFQKKSDSVILNHDNTFTRKMVGHCPGRIVFFRKNKKDKSLRSQRFVHIRGEHNLENMLAASAVARVLRVSEKDIRYVLQTFRGLPNRQEIIRVHRGVMWVNDTTATTPEATIAALHRFTEKQRNKETKRHIVLIVGGTDKGLTTAQFSALAREIKKTCKAVILLPGTATIKLKSALQATSYPIGQPSATYGASKLQAANSMREAIQLSKKQAERNDIVLLSPGAASFGLFKNEFDRGAQFVRMVKAL